MMRKSLCSNAIRHIMHIHGCHMSPKAFTRVSSATKVVHAALIHTTPNHWLFKKDMMDPNKEYKEKQLTIRHADEFDKIAQKSKDKQTFHLAVNKFITRSGKYRRGHVEFMYAAMDYMETFQVHKDIESYKLIMELFPKYKMVTYKTWEVEFMHYPKQQQCCIDVLDQMEDNGVCPDDDMGHRLMEIFGNKSHVFRKYQRMMYWMPKFKNSNPYPIPFHLPDDPIELAMLALKRMAVDLQNKLSVFRSVDLAEEAFDKTYIVSAISPTQSELLSNYSPKKNLFVEGGFPVWLREQQLTYFVLRGDVSSILKENEEYQIQQEDDSNLFNWKLFYGHEESEKAVMKLPSVHEQEDGTIMAMCITGTSSKDSLMSWIRCLQETHPKLKDIPVVFQLRTPEEGLLVNEEKDEQKEVSIH